MQKGKIYLAQALILMMETQPIKDISVKELVKKAGVSRMTYYRYYFDKKDILKDYTSYILEEYDKQIEKKTTHSFHSYEHILESLVFFREHMQFALCLRKAGLETLLLDELNKYVSKQTAYNKSSAVRSYPFYYYAGALFNCYMQWISDNASTPAEQLAAIIHKI